MRHLGQSEHLLVHNYGHSLGQTWAALAAFKGPLSRRRVVSSADVDDETEASSETGSESGREELSRVKRVRRGTPDGFVNSSLIQAGSSSPADDGSHGTLDSSVGYVDGGPDGFMPLEEDTVRQQTGGSFVLTKNQVAALEAKRRFQLIEDGKPVISDECFAQMACEAIAARLVDPLGELRHER